MKNLCFTAAIIAVAVGGATIAGRAAAPRPGIDWPSFRGIHASGVAEGHPTLTTWDATKGEGLRWKTPIEGLGLSSPVIWGDRLCVTTAREFKRRKHVRPFGLDDRAPFFFACHPARVCLLHNGEHDAKMRLANGIKLTFAFKSIDDKLLHRCQQARSSTPAHTRAEHDSLPRYAGL